MSHPAWRTGGRWLALAVVFYLSAAGGFAASITWGAPMTISGDTDVTNSGAALYAYAGGAVTVNGISFAATGNGTTWGNVSFTSFGGFNAVFGASASPFGSLSTAYQSVLSTAAWGSGTAGTVTLNGLTSGHAYTVQIWVDDSRGTYQYRYESVSSSGGNTVTLYFAPNSNSAGAVGQYVVGTFTAAGTSQTFTVNGNSVVQINAINVRDNGPGVVTPLVLTPTRVNLAKYQPVTTDSSTGTQTGQYITDDLTVDCDYWQSGTSGAHWAQVVFPFPVTVGSAQLVMGRDTVVPPTVFWLQYLTNGTWMTVPGTTVVGNTNKERNLIFTAPVTAASFRFYEWLSIRNGFFDQPGPQKADVYDCQYIWQLALAGFGRAGERGFRMGDHAGGEQHFADQLAVHEQAWQRAPVFRGDGCGSAGEFCPAILGWGGLAKYSRRQCGG